MLKDGDTLWVSTGDAKKYLDRWTLRKGRMAFEARVLGVMGGFTACAKVRDRTFFGSDFSERPNYIFCLETGQKWFFPRPAYTRYCTLMLPFESTYLFCVNKALLKRARALTIFDTRKLAFTCCEAVPESSLDFARAD